MCFEGFSILQHDLTTFLLGDLTPRLESSDVLTRPLFKRMPVPNSLNYAN